MKFYFIETPGIEELKARSIDEIWCIESEGIMSWMQRKHHKLHWLIESGKTKHILCPLFAGLRTSEFAVFDIVKFDLQAQEFSELPKEVKTLLDKQHFLKLNEKNKPDVKTQNFDYDSLREAFNEAITQAEGYPSNLQIPIYRNQDGTYEAGGILDSNTSDISDGTFKEIGRIEGWDAELFDSVEGSEQMTKEEKIKEVMNQKGDYFFIEFCEKFGVENK